MNGAIAALFRAISFMRRAPSSTISIAGTLSSRGKSLWEANNCIGCHTLLGEGAYFAPELGNVYVRYGKNKEAIKAFIQSRPAEGIAGRRSMPQFNFTDEQLNAIVAFLKHVNSINTANWPPNSQG